MAISVAYGVLFGTIILLLYFPPLILYFNDIKRTRKWIWEGGENAPMGRCRTSFRKSKKNTRI
jgi:hypothetical protein